MPRPDFELPDEKYWPIHAQRRVNVQPVTLS
jgi:hypothetical protein